MDTPRKVDAILFPPGYAFPEAAGASRDERRDNFCRALIGSPMHYRISNPVFVTTDPHDTINFPKQSDREGFPRYDWEDQGYGVSYGYLKGEAKPKP